MTRVRQEEATNIANAIRVMISLGIVAMLLTHAPLAAAEPCLNTIEGKSNSLQIIFDVWTDALIIGAKASEPGDGKTLIVVIKPNSCTSSGVGPDLLEKKEIEPSDASAPSPPRTVLPLP